MVGGQVAPIRRRGLSTDAITQIRLRNEGAQRIRRLPAWGIRCGSKLTGVGPITAPQKTVRGHLDEACAIGWTSAYGRPGREMRSGTQSILIHMPVSGQVQHAPDGRLVHPQAGVDAGRSGQSPPALGCWRPMPQVGQRRASKVSSTNQPRASMHRMT